MKPTSKQARRAELDREFEKGTMQATEYRQRLDDIRLAPDVEPVAPDQPDVFATVAAVRASLKNVAATVAPLLSRVDAMERKLRLLDESGNALSLSQLAHSIALLNEKLSQPVQAVFDNDGRVVGAQRVRRLDS